MKSLTEEKPKCLIEFRGRPLLSWQIEAMRGAGIQKIAAVCGYRGEMLDGFGLSRFTNDRWVETNMVRSLLSAGEWLDHGPCTVSYSDIFYPAAAVSALVNQHAAVAITYDPNWLQLWKKRFGDPLLDAETFKLDADSILTDIGRRPSVIEEVEGQYMGLLRFTREGWRTISDFLAALSPSEVDRLDMTSMLNRLLAAGARIKAVATPVEWGEVDHESDLRLYSA